MEMDSLVVKKSGVIEWIVHDLSRTAGIYSPKFSTVCLDASRKRVNMQWQLYLQSYTKLNFDDCVAIGLKNLTDAETSVTFEVNLHSSEGFMDQRTKQKKLGKNECCVLEWYTDDVLSTFGISYLEELEYLKIVSTISNVKTRAFGGLEREDDGEFELATQHESILEVVEFSDESELVTMYEGIFEAGEFSDVVFNVGGKSMHLHKAFLANTSEVFRAMFKHEMKEQKMSVVNVVDVDFDVMKEMMRYIYARKVNGMEKIAAELFVAADRYAVDGLRLLCEEKLFEKLNVDNVLSRFELSMKYGMENLKAKVLGFVVGHMRDLVDRQEFKELSSDCKDELFKYISTKTII